MQARGARAFAPCFVSAVYTCVLGPTHFMVGVPTGLCSVCLSELARGSPSILLLVAPGHAPQEPETTYSYKVYKLGSRGCRPGRDDVRRGTGRGICLISFPRNTSPVMCAIELSASCGPTRGAACTSRPLPTYFCASGMPMALFFEDFSPISSKHKSVKSLKSLYGADMMTGCLSLEVHY
jgi:hypothetical protein